MNDFEAGPLSANEALTLSEQNQDAWANPIFGEIRMAAKQGKRSLQLNLSYMYGGSWDLARVEALLRSKGYHVEREWDEGYRERKEATAYNPKTGEPPPAFERYCTEVLRVVW